MTCEFAFLAVGNADSIIVSPEDGPSIVVDIPKPRVVFDYLKDRENFSIGSIYITHSHRDHFAPFSSFVAFLEQWLRLPGSVNNVFIDREAYIDAFTELAKLETTRPKKYKELHHALERLLEWRVRTIKFQYPNQSLKSSYEASDLAVYVLHPELLFAAKHVSKFRRRLNERSIVLKITYRGFAALLLADIEKEGLDDILELYSTMPEVLHADLVKIPHHGAWPPNSSSLEALLKTSNAQLAILSVGSRNPYGHVVPALFLLLNTLIADPSFRLNKFLCTEVTRTCVFSSLARKGAGNTPLAERRLCAGDIIVRVDDGVAWTHQTQTDHASVVKSLRYAACEHRGDF
jgi:beta-lactamase superfamily II metal-dependent hydrolase